VRIVIKRGRISGDPGLFAALLLAGVVMTNFVQVWVTNTPFLQSRLSLFYYPLTALVLACTGEWIRERFRWGALAYALPLTFLVLLNNVRCLNLQNAYEWWYDSATIQVLDYLKQTHAKEKPAEPYKMDVHWAALNSFGVHMELMQPEYKQYVRPMNWHPNRPPQRDGDNEFYYAVSPDEIKDLLDVFDIVYRVPESSFLLLRRKK
jgi:hypothetical protein